MSTQTPQPDPTPHTNQPLQNMTDTSQATTDEVPLHQSSDDDEATLTDPASHNSQNGQTQARELGDPTAPMPVQPASTIQIPALQPDAASALTEDEDIPLAPSFTASTPDSSNNTPMPIVHEDVKTPLAIVPTPVQSALPIAPTPAFTGTTPTTATPVPNSPQIVPRTQLNPFLSVEDLAEIQLVGEPQVSPDGLLIAYSILKNDLIANKVRSSIWLVPVIAGTSGKLQQPRQLTASAFHSTVPRWSPDGRWLAFLSDRSGSTQVYVLPLNGGEARQVSFLAQAVSDYSWRPDGRALLLQSPWKIEDDEGNQLDETIAQVWTRLDETWDGQGYKHGRQEHLWLLNLER